MAVQIFLQCVSKSLLVHDQKNKSIDIAHAGHHQIDRKVIKYFRILFQFFMKYSLQDAHLFGIYGYVLI